MAIFSRFSQLQTGQVGRVLPRVLIGLLLVVGAFSLTVLAIDPLYQPSAGYDFGIYRDAAARWLHGGSFYYPEQLAGPYTVISGHVMYPPVGLVLFIPFTALPGILWWVIPLGVIAWRVVVLRPAIWGWVGVAALACWPYSVELAFTGNPTIWITAILALATRWPWFSAFVLLKPSLFPFACAGVSTRAWWIALSVFACASLLFLPMWADWVRVVLNARGVFSGLLYSVKDLPWMLIPVVAWVSRRRSTDGPSAVA